MFTVADCPVYYLLSPISIIKTNKVVYMSLEYWVDLVINDENTGWKVSNEGRFITSYNEIAKQPIRHNGYKCVNVRGRTHNSHRLVALMFCEKKDGCETVDHVDGDKLNNNAENLEWVSQSENNKRAFKNNQYKNKPKLLIKEVLKIVELRERNMSISEISKIMGCDTTTVIEILRGKTYPNITGIGKDCGDGNVTNFFEKN